MKKPVDLRVYAILDPILTQERDPCRIVEQAIAGGITMLQLRDKRGDSAARLMLAQRIKQLCQPHNVPLIINDSPSLAKQVDADGVHLGKSDPSPDEARSLLGEDAIVGITIHHPEDASEIGPGLADYAGLGPVYLTQSKDPGDPPLGPFGLHQLINDVHQTHPDMPCVAIAGVNHKNAGPLIEAGADGIAVIGDIFKASDVEAAARRLRTMIDRALGIERAA